QPAYARTEVIKDDRMLPPVDQHVDHVAAYIAGPAGNKNAHKSNPPLDAVALTPGVRRSKSDGRIPVIDCEGRIAVGCASHWAQKERAGLATGPLPWI